MKPGVDRALQITALANRLSLDGRHEEAADVYEVEADAWRETADSDGADLAMTDAYRERSNARAPRRPVLHVSTGQGSE